LGTSTVTGLYCVVEEISLSMFTPIVAYVS
jgi:hypothetical protein